MTSSMLERVCLVVVAIPPNARQNSGMIVCLIPMVRSWENQVKP